MYKIIGGSESIFVPKNHKIVMNPVLYQKFDSEWVVFEVEIVIEKLKSLLETAVHGRGRQRQ